MYLYEILISVSVVSILVALSEITCVALYIATGKKILISKKFRPTKPYPLKSSKYFKIGVFGGSAASGYGANISFSSLIGYEINKRIPCFVKNHAICGIPFGGYQGRIVKKLIKKYDLIIIYAGNNEFVEPLVDKHFLTSGDSTYLNKIVESELRKFWLESSKFSPLRYARELHTFNLAVDISKRIFRKLGSHLSRSEDTKKPSRSLQKRPRPDEFTSNLLLDENTKTKYLNRLQSDLDEIHKLAKKHGCKIILAPALNNELVEPIQSFVHSSIGTSDIKEQVSMIQTLIDDENLEKAKEETVRLNSQNPNLAIGFYLMARIELELGNIDRSRFYFDQAFNHQGIILRCTNLIENIFKNFNDNLTSFYAPTRTIADRFIPIKENYEQLFSDFVHPSDLGHCLISFALIKQISDLKGLDLPNPYSSNLNFNRLENYRNNCLKVFRITRAQICHTEWLNLRWHLSFVDFVCYRETYLNRAENLIEIWFNLTTKSSSDYCEYHFWKAVLAMQRGDVEKSSRFLNSAKSQSMGQYHDLVSQVGSTGNRWRESFALVGITV